MTKKPPIPIKDIPVISVQIRFRGETSSERAKHIEALIKLLDKHALSYRLARSK
jgi:hypothetical protein